MRAWARARSLAIQTCNRKLCVCVSWKHMFVQTIHMHTPCTIWYSIRLQCNVHGAFVILRIIEWKLFAFRGPKLFYFSFILCYWKVPRFRRRNMKQCIGKVNTKHLNDARNTLTATICSTDSKLSICFFFLFFYAVFCAHTPTTIISMIS